MLTRKAKLFLKKSVKSAYLVGAAPYQWDSKAEKIITTKSISRKLIWFLNCTAFVIYEAFLVYQLARWTHLHSLDTATYSKIETLKRASELMNLRYKAITWLLPIAFQVSTYVRWEQFAQFVNLYIRCFDKLRVKYVVPGRKDKFKGSLDIVGPYILYLGYLIATLQSIGHFRRPNQLALISSLFADQKRVSPLIRISVAIYHSYLIWCFTFLMQLYTFAMMAYTSSALLVLRELRYTPSWKTCLTVPEFRSIATFRKVYNRIRYLHRLFNEVYSHFEIPFTKTVLMSAVVLGIYGCVRLESIRAVQVAGVAVASFITLKSTYTGFSNVFLASQEVILSWKNRKLSMFEVLQSPDFKKVIDSFPPFPTRVGYFYKAETRTIVLIIMGVLLNQVVSVLVAF